MLLKVNKINKFCAPDWILLFEVHWSILIIFNTIYQILQSIKNIPGYKNTNKQTICST